jgi:hypothetical protein
MMITRLRWAWWYCKKWSEGKVGANQVVKVFLFSFSYSSKS